MVCSSMELLKSEVYSPFHSELVQCEHVIQKGDIAFGDMRS